MKTNSVGGFDGLRLGVPTYAKDNAKYLSCVYLGGKDHSGGDGRRT
jgi:hypothetical protein